MITALKSMLATTAALSALALSGCSVNATETKSASPLPGPANGTQDKVIDVTDKAQCRYGAPASRLDGRWQYDLRQGEFNFHMVFDFRNGYLTLTNNCEFRGHQLAAVVGAPYMDQRGQVTIMAEANKTERASSGGTDLTCSAAISRGRMTYSFNGSCLEMRAEGTNEVLTLVPASYF